MQRETRPLHVLPVMTRCVCVRPFVLLFFCDGGSTRACELPRLGLDHHILHVMYGGGGGGGTLLIVQFNHSRISLFVAGFRQRSHTRSLYILFFFSRKKLHSFLFFPFPPAMAKYSDNCADDVDTVLSKLQSDASTGLSSKEVEARQAIYGKNELPEEEGKKAFLTSRCALSLCESCHVWKNVTVVE